MITIHDTYAVFEANQVLTPAHLNDTFAYHDEQERLTRANLIGIGILCGLEVGWDAANSAFDLSKGCGVTSQGYLVVEPEDVTLVSWRRYTLPEPVPYPTFEDDAAVPKEQFELWELFPAGEPGTEPLSSGALPLNDKAVVLFVELDEQGLRTCSPNSCDDRGAAVTATVRRLLIRTADLAKIIAAANASGGDPALGAAAVDLLARLQLPDLRLPRVDVPNSAPVTSEDLLLAFHTAFRTDKLAARTGAALAAVYQAFKPLVAQAYPTDPFANFDTTFGFLDTAPTTTTEVRFLQYYWDLFADILRAYDELRWAGVELLCACCPPDALFPRHLMLGVVDPATVAEPSHYRQQFMPSPALSDCEARTNDLLLLFRRLVGMLEGFTNTPALPEPGHGPVDEQIRITPSVWGDAALGTTAIPYYYRQDGAPPLYQVWNAERSRRKRADHNLSYRADEYGSQTPTFVTDPLRYELEPHDFLRIEGHLGKNVRTVMTTLLNQRVRYRLPIEIVALRTGAFDQSIPIDLAKEDCRFDDVEAIYATLKAELSCFLCKEVRYFYDLPTDHRSLVITPKEPALPLLRNCAPGYLVQPGTVGRLIEDVLDRGRGFLGVFGRGEAALRSEFVLLTYSLVTSLSALWTQLSADVRHLDFDGFGTCYEELVDVAERFEHARAAAAAQGGPPPFLAAGMADRLSDIIFRCRLDPFRALEEEYKRRIRKAQQAQFLSFFLRQHPGIQHKAGAPLGGTFILVYHESPSTRPPTGSGRSPIPGAADEPRPPIVRGDIERLGPLRSLLSARYVDESALSRALTRLQFDPRLADNPDVQSVYQLLTGDVLVGRRPPIAEGNRIYVDAVAELGDGTVIADFFLPYICCSDCSPMHYTLPKDRPRLSLQPGCTDANGNAEVTLTAQGANGAISVQVDGAEFTASTGKLLLGSGSHTVVIRDDEGAESAPTTIVVPPALTIGIEQITEDEQAGTYQVNFEVSGGTPPYAAEPGTLDGTAYTSPAANTGEALTVTITDNAGCKTDKTFQHTVGHVCDLPCEGMAVRAGFRFWIPEAKQGQPVNEYSAEVATFSIEGPQGAVDLTNDVNDVVNRAPNALRSTEFDQVVGKWMNDINELIARAVGSPDWVHVEYAGAGEGSTTGTLWIDRLQCIDVAFKLRVTFTQRQRRQDREVTYSSDGTRLRSADPQWRVAIPPFDAVTSNKCHPEQPPVEVCRDVDLNPDFRKTGAFPDAVALIARASGNDTPVAFLWEVQDGVPPLANGDSAEFKFDPPEPTRKLVRLTAFTERGCTAVIVREIDIQQG